MKNSVKRTLSLAVSLIMLISCFSFSQLTAAAADGITAKFAGWFETAYAEWTPVSGAGFYEAYVKSSGSSSYELLDDELIRQYDTYIRADAVGLPAGSYDMKIVAYKSEGGDEIASAEGTDITVSAYDRSGSAFSTKSTLYDGGAIGAYENDGSLKSNAKVFYVTADTAATITTDVITNSKGSTTTCTGIQDIIDKYQKGYDTTPIAFRIVGTVTADDVDSFSSSSEGIQVKGKNVYSEMPMTFEGIGNDAAVSGFGFLIRNAGSVEFRNFAVLNFMDDGISLDTDNCNVWVHNMDLFYGDAGSAADQVKGDGSVDIKSDSQFITVSYNHFWDSGKSSLCGMKSESGNNYITYHHNWFDHSDSRHPRVRTMSVHIYNNFYDGNAKYGAASALAASLFVEQNYFRSCKYPVLIGGQGSEGGTTLSGEKGAPIKMYGNVMTGTYKYIDYTDSSSSFDGYTVSSRDETIPSSVTAAGGTYNNFDTEYSEYLGVDESDVDAAADVPSIVMAEAGRCNGGDIFYTFSDSEDTNSSIISELKSMVTGYTSSLRVVGGTVDSSKCNSSAAASAATGVDGCKAYTSRDAANKADGAELAEEGGGSSSGGDSGSGEEDEPSTATGYDLKLVGSDVATEATTLDATVSGIKGSGESEETGAFTIYATSAKPVSISGDEIRLGGSGSVSDGYRVIAVTLSKAGTITVTASNPGTTEGDKRTIAISDGSSDLNTLEIDYGQSGTVTAKASSAGTYYVYSKGSNIYVTLVGVSYSSSSSETSTETTTETTTEGSSEESTEEEESSTEETSSETTTEEEIFTDDGNADESTEEETEETTEEEEEDDSSSSATGTLIWNRTTGENTLGVSFSGNAWSSAKNHVLTYNEESLSAAVKMETNKSLTFTTTSAGTLTLVFYSTNSAPTVKVDETTYTLTPDSALISDGNGYTLTLALEAGSHTITKGTTDTYLYYASVAYTSTKGDVDYDGDIDDTDAAIALKIASELYSEDNYTNADYDGDGYVTIIDVIMILKSKSSSSGGSSEESSESTTEGGTEATTEASGESSDGFSWTYTSDSTTLPTGLSITGLGDAGTRNITFSDGTTATSGVKITEKSVITITASSAGTIKLYMVRNGNSSGTASVTIDGKTADSLSLSARNVTTADVPTITLTAGATVVITPDDSEELLCGITYTAS